MTAKLLWTGLGLAVLLCYSQTVGSDECAFGNEAIDQEPLEFAVHLVQASVTLVKDARAPKNTQVDRALEVSPSNATLVPFDALKAGVGTPGDNVSAVPSGSDFWDQETSWVSVRKFHPQGVVSTMNPFGEPQWLDVSYVSLTYVIILCSVAYPAILVGFLLASTILVSMCLVAKGSDDENTSATPEQTTSNDAGHATLRLFPELPVFSKQNLTYTSKKIYGCWAIICCTLPCVMVFGTPALMMALARPYPQEVLISLTLLTSAFLFGNSIHLMIFAGKGLLELSMARPDQSSEPAEEQPEVLHWVILPQYKEEVEVVSMTLRSVAQCAFAKSAVGVVLAFEEREVGAQQKAEILRRSFEGQFKEILVAYHPAGLPNDPPGKASNLCWAFKELLRHVGGDMGVISNSILTVADADSEFAAGYFEALSTQFLDHGPSTRYNRIWQSPVLHLKNFHRQPAPVVVGTVFTAMQELAQLSDTNAVRFPYSTYSLSMQLARNVGGWDPEWIAEDYHMGIKCFLMTLGRTTVEPVMLATLNYVPEEDGNWWGTCMARWVQLKRHALGFSDFSYYFMMLPLVFAYVTTKAANKEGMDGMVSFWRMLFHGTALIVRLVNVHVLIGVLSTYGAFELVLKLLMKFVFFRSIWVDFLFTNISFLSFQLMFASVFCTTVTTLVFFQAYLLLQDRIEGTPSIKWPALHWLKILLSVACASPFYFVMLAYAIWCAAISVLTRSSFEYHVAPKPTFRQNLKSSDAQQA